MDYGISSRLTGRAGAHLSLAKTFGTSACCQHKASQSEGLLVTNLRDISSMFRRFSLQVLLASETLQFPYTSLTKRLAKHQDMIDQDYVT